MTGADAGLVEQRRHEQLRGELHDHRERLRARRQRRTGGDGRGHAPGARRVGVEATTENVAVTGRGDLGFYAPATTDLGVGGRWDTYTATLSGTTSLRVATDGLAVNGTPLPSGTYTIATTAATLTGFGPSTSPAFAGTASVDLTAGVVSLGPGSGTLTVGGAALPLTTGFTLSGFTGTIDVTAGVSTDTVALDGAAEHVLRVSANPAAVSATRSIPGTTTVSVFTSLADAYVVDVRAPDEWTVTVDASGVVNVTPAAGLSGGIVPISVTARSRSRPELVAQADLVVTVGATAPAVIVRVDPDPLFTVPFAGAQVPSAFRAVIRNLGPTDTFALTFPTVPCRLHDPRERDPDPDSRRRDGGSRDLSAAGRPAPRARHARRIQRAGHQHEHSGRHRE